MDQNRNPRNRLKCRSYRNVMCRKGSISNQEGMRNDSIYGVALWEKNEVRLVYVSNVSSI